MSQDRRHVPAVASLFLMDLPFFKPERWIVVGMGRSGEVKPILGISTCREISFSCSPQRQKVFEMPFLSCFRTREKVNFAFCCVTRVPGRCVLSAVRI